MVKYIDNTNLINFIGKPRTSVFSEGGRPRLGSQLSRSETRVEGSETPVRSIKSASRDTSRSQMRNNLQDPEYPTSSHSMNTLTSPKVISPRVKGQIGTYMKWE